MFDLFGIITRIKANAEKRRARLLAEAQEKRRVYQERKSMIERYLDDERSRRHQIESEKYSTRKKDADKINSKCPHCGSTDIINVIIRTKGEIHGEGSYHSHGYSYFGTGLFSGNGSGRIDGEMDTYPVNKCKSCGHEWNRVEPEWKSEDDIYCTSKGFDYPEHFFLQIKRYLNMKHDPYDKNEKFNSLEEKRENLLSNGEWMMKRYKGAPKYMMDYILCKGIQRYLCNSYIDEKISKIFGYDSFRDDEYSYVMPDAIYEIVKKFTER